MHARVSVWVTCSTNIKDYYLLLIFYGGFIAFLMTNIFGWTNIAVMWRKEFRIQYPIFQFSKKNSDSPDTVSQPVGENNPPLNPRFSLEPLDPRHAKFLQSVLCSLRARHLLISWLKTSSPNGRRCALSFPLLLFTPFAHSNLSNKTQNNNKREVKHTLDSTRRIG